MVISIHIGSSVLAIISGAFVLLLNKGDRWHIILGRVYAVSMITLAAVSFGIYEVTGSFYIFHAISIQSLFFTLAGLCLSRFLRTQISQWIIWHGRFMVYSYITLIVTGIAQFFDQLPFENTTLRAIVFLSIPAITGWALYEFWKVPQLKLESPQ